LANGFLYTSGKPRNLARSALMVKRLVGLKRTFELVVIL